jgi:hypothetical protein
MVVRCKGGCEGGVIGDIFNAKFHAAESALRLDYGNADAPLPLPTPHPLKGGLLVSRGVLIYSNDYLSKWSGNPAACVEGDTCESKISLETVRLDSSEKALGVRKGVCGSGPEGKVAPGNAWYSWQRKLRHCPPTPRWVTTSQGPSSVPCRRYQRWGCLATVMLDSTSIIAI